MIGIYMFGAALLLLITGYPVAFIFGLSAMIFGGISAFVNVLPDDWVFLHFFSGWEFSEIKEEFFQMFSAMPFRIFSLVQNKILMSVPMFIFMGVVLQKSNLATKLLESIGVIFKGVSGGLAVGTVLIGTLLATSTGVVGASVVAMGAIALPVMLKHGYPKGLSTGVICASGTLGQIIPPSIVLIILSDVFSIPIGDIFKGAILPSVILVASYIVYILIYSYFNKDLVPDMEMDDENKDRKQILKKAIFDILPTITLIFLVLGSILGGVATPTESASIGAIGALFLAWLDKSLSFSVVKKSSIDTLKTTAIVGAILIGATAFSMVFVYSGGDEVTSEFMTGLPGDKWGFLILSMISIMVLGFFIDFIEISYIVVPILIPIAISMGINPAWFAVLIALNLQTSFLSPPFGFSLFYLKGVAPPSIKTTDIYKGVVPFIILQISVLISVIVFPSFYGF